MINSQKSDFVRSLKRQKVKTEWALLILGTLMFITIMYGFRVIQDQQNLIIAYEEYQRANSDIMYCVFTQDTLTK